MNQCFSTTASVGSGLKGAAAADNRFLGTPVLAKPSKSSSLIDCISVGVDRMQPNFEPMLKQVEMWQKSELTDVTLAARHCEPAGRIDRHGHVQRRFYGFALFWALGTSVSN